MATVDYFINLAGNAVQMAEQFVKAFANIQDSAKALGTSVDTTESALKGMFNAASTGAANATGALENLRSEMGRVAEAGSAAQQKIAAQADAAARGLGIWYGGALTPEREAEIAAFRAKAQANYDSKFSNNPKYFNPDGSPKSEGGGGWFGWFGDGEAHGKGGRGEGPGRGGGGSLIDNAWKWYFNFQLAKMGAEAAGSFIDVPAQVDTIRRNFQLAGVSQPDIDRAQGVAEKLTATTGNMSIAENMELIYDARSNLIGSFDDILKDVEAFSKLGSFFKAWDGGKHKGAEKDLLKELNLAMRSGELAGNVTGEELSKSTMALAAMKVLYGDKLNVGQYFTAQKGASAAFPMMEDTFKYIDFPSLVQIMGPNAGRGFATLMQKTMAGIMVRQQSADAWLAAGLVNPDADWKVKPGEKGWSKSLPANWLMGSEEMGRNPFRWVMQDVLPHLGTLGAKGIDANAILEAMKTGSSEGLKIALDKIDKPTLFSALGKLGYDRNAVQMLQQLINRAPMILRDEAMMKQIGDPTQYENYAKSIQDVQTSWNSLVNAMTGKDFVPFVTAQVKGIADILNQLKTVITDVKGAWDGLWKGDLSGAKTGGKDFINWLAGKKEGQPTDAGLAGRVLDKLNAAQNQPGRQPFAGPHVPTWSPAAVAAQAQRIQVDSRVKVDPIQLNVPPSITVNVTGPGISGTGSIPLSSSAPRGQALPEGDQQGH